MFGIPTIIHQAVVVWVKVFMNRKKVEVSMEENNEQGATSVISVVTDEAVPVVTHVLDDAADNTTINDNLVDVCTLINVIFLESIVDSATHHTRQLQLAKLHRWIGEHFVNRLSARYEWFALWRILYDKKLIVGTRAMTSKFARQMNEWYPDAPSPCVEGEVNRFRNGYLGQTPFTLWDEQTYLKQIQGKQSYSAFKQLYDLCNDLYMTLRVNDFYQ